LAARNNGNSARDSEAFEEIMLAYLYIIFAVVFRLVPHGAWNFTPVGAALLYFGARPPRRRMWIPLAMLAASDLVLTIFVYRYPLDATYALTWLWYAAAILLGSILRQRTTVARLLGASLACSVSFFFVSNFAVWATGTMYPLTLAGLGACYVAAIPFFRNTVASDLLFSAVLFGIPAVVALMSRARARAAA
jgi:hypothetical protein